MNSAARSSALPRPLLLLISAGLVLLVVFGQLPFRGRWAITLSNSAHGPVFAALAAVFLHLLRSRAGEGSRLRRDCIVAAAIAMAVGAMIELVQLRIGRDASFQDVGTDLLGVIAGIALYLRFVEVRGPPRDRNMRALRRGCTLAALLAILLIFVPFLVSGAAYADRVLRFPLLMDAGRPLGTYFMQPYWIEARPRRLPDPWQAAGTHRTGLHVALTDDERWGLALLEASSDWRGYDALTLELINPTSEPLVLNLRLFDRHHNLDHRFGYRTKITLSPGRHETLVVPLDRAAASQSPGNVDLSQAGGFVLSGHRTNRAMEFYLLRSALVRGSTLPN